jgi:KDO2-lipid IV(A) lauroyltransferase
MRAALRAAAAWLQVGAFLFVIAPALVLPFDVARRGYAALARFLLPRTPFVARIAGNMAATGFPADPRALAGAVGDNFMRMVVEFSRTADFARRRDLRRPVGLDHLRAAVAAGRGVVIVSAHYGNWEAIRLSAREAGVEVGLIYRAFNNPVFDRLVQSRAAWAGGPLMHKGRAGQRELLRRLKAGGAVLILLDQRLGGGPEIDLLGTPTRTNTAVAAMAQRLGATLLPAVARRAEDGLSFDVIFEPPVEAETPEAAMAAINARFGAWIAAAPGQWFWLHRRWKTRR